MRTIDRYIGIEILKTELATGFILGLVIVGGTLVRIVKMSVDGVLPVTYLAPVVAYESLKAILLLSPVILFLAVMLVFGRLYRDSEMVAMQAAGIGQESLLRVLAWIVIPMTVILLVLMLVVYPWGANQSYQLQKKGQVQAGLSLLKPGGFMPLINDRAVGYVGRIEKPGHRLENIFIHARSRQSRPMIIWARSGRQVFGRDGLLSIELFNGERLLQNPSGTTWQVMRFQRYQARRLMTVNLNHRPIDAVPTRTLLAQPTTAHLAELEWRLSIPLSLFILALLAVPLSHARPRQGRFGQLLIGIVIYAMYANLLIMAKSWMLADRASLAMMLVPHVLLLILVLVVWVYRFRVWRRWRRRTAT